MSIDKKKYNENICFLLVIILSLPLLTNFFGGISSLLSGTTMYSTYTIYALVLVSFMFKFRLSGKQFYFFLIYTSILLGAALFNKVIFPRSSAYMFANREVLFTSIVLYYPVAYGMVFVDDWSAFFRYMRIPAFWTPFLCWIAIELFMLEEIIDYMQISNSLLPGFLASWYIARMEKKRVYYLSVILSMYLQLFHGGRMSFASALVFIILLEVINLRNDSSRKGIIKVTTLLIMGVIWMGYNEQILEGFLRFLESLKLTDSRTVQFIIEGSIFESKTRDLIYERAWYEMKKMGAGMYGLFGDRIAFEKYGGIIYVHNIFYELILSFGWIIGGIMSVWLIVKNIKGIFAQKIYEKRVMVAYFVSLIFLRLLVSGSFLIEGQFLFLIGILCNNCCVDNTKELELNLSSEGSANE